MSEQQIEIEWASDTKNRPAVGRLDRIMMGLKIDWTGESKPVGRRDGDFTELQDNTFSIDSVSCSYTETLPEHSVSLFQLERN